MTAAVSVDPPLRAVPGVDADLVAVRHGLAAQAGGEALADERPELGMRQLPGAHGEDLRGGEAGQLLDGPVDVEHPLGAVDDDGRRGGLGQGTEPQIAFARKLEG